MAEPKKLTLEELAAQYGYAAAFFFSDPELKALIEQAVREQWTADKFRAKFMATNWYRSKTADVRTWLELEARDPTEAAQRIGTQVKLIQNLASQMGVTIDPARAEALARESLMWGWQEVFLKQAVAAEFRYQPSGGTQGQAATLETTLRQLAHDYGVTVSDSQIGEWVGGALAGKFTEDHLRDFVADMARSKYAGMAPLLDAGFTVRQIAEPYMQSYSQILEVPHDTVDLQDRLVQQALQGRSPDGKQPPQMQSVYDFEVGLRKDPRWLRTKNARESMTNAALGVLTDWGLYA